MWVWQNKKFGLESRGHYSIEVRMACYHKINTTLYLLNKKTFLIIILIL